MSGQENPQKEEDYRLSSSIHPPPDSWNERCLSMKRGSITVFLGTLRYTRWYADTEQARVEDWWNKGEGVLGLFLPWNGRASFSSSFSSLLGRWNRCNRIFLFWSSFYQLSKKSNPVFGRSCKKEFKKWIWMFSFSHFLRSKLKELPRMLLCPLPSSPAS